jgi:hypothetical protein
VVFEHVHRPGEEIALSVHSAAGSAVETEHEKQWANRLLVIATVANASVQTRVGDERSLREALELLGGASQLLARALGDVRSDVLNVLHEQALAAVQLGELD